MANKQKMWALMVYLANRYPQNFSISDILEQSFWEYILEESAKCGINTILLDVGNGVEFGSHPEIAVEGAWSRRKVRKEIEDFLIDAEKEYLEVEERIKNLNYSLSQAEAILSKKEADLLYKSFYNKFPTK